jgi:hypothetical protein
MPAPPLTDILPQVAAPAQSPDDAGVGPGFVSNRTQNIGVNPLTRLANRSVMHASYSVAAR